MTPYMGTAAKLGVHASRRHCHTFRWGVWARGTVLRLVETGAEGEGQARDVIEIGIGPTVSVTSALWV